MWGQGNLNLYRCKVGAHCQLWPWCEVRMDPELERFLNTNTKDTEPAFEPHIHQSTEKTTLDKLCIHGRKRVNPAHTLISTSNPQKMLMLMSKAPWPTQPKLVLYQNLQWTQSSLFRSSCALRGIIPTELFVDSPMLSYPKKSPSMERAAVFPQMLLSLKASYKETSYLSEATETWTCENTK